MKRIAILALLISLSILIFAGCQDKVSGTLDNPIVNYDNEAIFYPDDISSNDESSKRFIVRDKKHSYKDKDVVIIQTENQTDKNYIVTITVTYLDDNNEIIKNETQTFDQFAAGYEHYFLFQPNINFNKFTYTFDAKETNETMYVNNIEFVFSGLEEAYWPIDELAEKGDMTPHPMIISLFGYKNISEDKSLGITTEGNVVLLNENDEIIAIYDISSLVYNTGETEFATHYIYYTLEEELEWPEEFKGEIRAFHATTKCIKK